MHLAFAPAARRVPESEVFVASSAVTAANWSSTAKLGNRHQLFHFLSLLRMSLLFERLVVVPSDNALVAAMLEAMQSKLAASGSSLLRVFLPPEILTATSSLNPTISDGIAARLYPAHYLFIFAEYQRVDADFNTPITPWLHLQLRSRTFPSPPAGHVNSSLLFQHPPRRPPNTRAASSFPEPATSSEPAVSLLVVPSTSALLRSGNLLAASFLDAVRILFTTYRSLLSSLFLPLWDGFYSRDLCRQFLVDRGEPALRLFMHSRGQPGIVACVLYTDFIRSDALVNSGNISNIAKTTLSISSFSRCSGTFFVLSFPPTAQPDHAWVCGPLFLAKNRRTTTFLVGPRV
jgi:hypothetical protein